MCGWLDNAVFESGLAEQVHLPVLLLEDEGIAVPGMESRAANIKHVCLHLTYLLGSLLPLPLIIVISKTKALDLSGVNALGYNICELCYVAGGASSDPTCVG